MKNRFLLAGLVATLLLTQETAAAAPKAGPGQKPAPFNKAVRYGMALAPGDAVPTFTGSNLDGKAADVTYDGSRATIVGFWSANCVPCRVQSVALQHLLTHHGGDGLQVVGLAVDSGPMHTAPTAVRAFMQETGGTYLVIRSSPEIETAWHGITVLPVAFLVGKDGKLVRRYVGADDPVIKGMLDDVEAYLAGRPLGDQPLPESLAAPAPDGSGGASPPR